MQDGELGLGMREGSGNREERSCFSCGCFGACFSGRRSREGSVWYVDQTQEGIVGSGGRDEGVSREEGEGGSGARQLGMREEIRNHFRMVRRAMNGEPAVRSGERVVRWDGPSVRPKVTPEKELLEELIVVLKALDDGFHVSGKVGMVKEGDELQFGRRKPMQLAFGVGL